MSFPGCLAGLEAISGSGARRRIQAEVNESNENTNGSEALVILSLYQACFVELVLVPATKMFFLII